MCDIWTQDQWISNANVVTNENGDLKYSVEQLFNDRGQRALHIHETGGIHWVVKREDGTDAFFTDNCTAVKEALTGYSSKRSTTVEEVLETIGALTPKEARRVAKSPDLRKLLSSFA